MIDQNWWPPSGVDVTDFLKDRGLRPTGGTKLRWIFYLCKVSIKCQTTLVQKAFFNCSSTAITSSVISMDFSKFLESIIAEDSGVWREASSVEVKFVKCLGSEDIIARSWEEICIAALPLPPILAHRGRWRIIKTAHAGAFATSLHSP